MANDKRFVAKNGLRTQNIEHVSPDRASSITATMLNSDTLSFEGDSGQLFSITDSLTGTIFSVNDITGIPSIEVDDDGTIRFAEFAGNVLIGTDTDNGVDKLQVNGSISGDGSNITKISVPTSDSPPSNPKDGELWWDSDEGNMFVYYADGSSNQWVPTSVGYPGPQGPQGPRGYTGSSSTTLDISNDTTTAPLYPVMVTGTGGGRNGRVNTDDLFFDSNTGQMNVSRLRVKTTSKQNEIQFYTEADTGNIGDTFSGTTDKSYIYFIQTNSSNDPGYIMHETRQAGETNEGILHLVPTDDNSGTDYVSIHGTNDPDRIRLYTSGLITGVSTLNCGKVNTGQGDNELYAMNQNVRTSDSVTFDAITSNGTLTTNGTLIVNSNCDFNGNVNINSGGETQLTIDGAGGSGDYLSLHIGESGAGAAAVHVQYRGDGLGWIGMGDTSGGTGLMSNWVMRMQYQSQDALFNNNVTVQNTLSAAAITETSSILVKENVKPIENSLAILRQLKGCTFDRLDNNEKNQSGLIAEQVKKILPNIVRNNDDNGLDEIHYTGLIAYLIEGIKELKEEIDILKSK